MFTLSVQRSGALAGIPPQVGEALHSRTGAHLAGSLRMATGEAKECCRLGLKWTPSGVMTTVSTPLNGFGTFMKVRSG